MRANGTGNQRRPLNLVEGVKRLAGHGQGLCLVRFHETQWLSALVPAQEEIGLMRELVLERVYELAGPLAGAGLVVDAGANVGLFSLMASQHARQVVALEPDPINHHVMMINLLVNGVTNVEAISAALWVDDHGVPFGRPAWEDGRGFVVSTASRVTDNGDHAAATITLDQLVERFGEIDLLKLDIEGAEHRVVPETAALGHIRRIVAELHLGSISEQDAIAGVLRDAGFDVRIVPVSSLYVPGRAFAVLRNWRRLRRSHLLKLSVLGRLLLPVAGAPPGRDLPLLVATRR